MRKAPGLPRGCEKKPRPLPVAAAFTLVSLLCWPGLAFAAAPDSASWASVPAAREKPAEEPADSLRSATGEPFWHSVSAHGATAVPGMETAPSATPDGAFSGADIIQVAAAPETKPASSPAPAGTGREPLRLFGTVEFRGVLKNMPKWERVVNAENKSRTFDQDLSKYMRGSLYKQWQQLVERVENKPVMDKAKAVTAFFNRWPYRTDQDVYKLPDYWATPAEFLVKSGDCEDFAITKFYALLKLGVPPDDMRIVALRDTIRNLAHAVLVVYIENNAYVLDNLTDMVLSHERYQHYNPQYSVNEIYRWAHVMPKKKR